MAYLTGISLATYRRLERGQIDLVPLSYLVDCASVLEVNVTELLDDGSDLREVDRLQRQRRVRAAASWLVEPLRDRGQALAPGGVAEEAARKRR